MEDLLENFIEHLGKNVSEKLGRELKNYVEKVILSSQNPFVNDNYEGSIIRNGGSLYESKRSFNLLKYKDFDDDEFEITGYTTEKDNDIDLVIWICKTHDNKYFNVLPQGSKEERRELHKNAKDYINKKLWLKFFSYTEGGVPRFPTTNRNTYTEYIRDVVE